MILDIIEWAIAAGFVALFVAVCFIPARRCPRGRYACPCCMRLDRPAGEGKAREYLDWLETAPTVSRERS